MLMCLFAGIYYFFSNAPNGKKRVRIVSQYTFKPLPEEMGEKQLNEFGRKRKNPMEKEADQRERFEQIKLQREIKKIIEENMNKRNENFKSTSHNKSEVNMIGLVKTEEDERKRNKG